MKPWTKTVTDFGVAMGWSLFKRKAVAVDPLDQELCRWSKENPFRVRHLLNSVAIFGGTGSGKTSGSGMTLGSAIVSYPNSGGLIIAAKPGEDRVMWERIFARAGRSSDLVIIDPSSNKCCNVLSYALSKGADTRDLTKMLTYIGETLGGGRGRGGEDGGFWEQQYERVIYNDIEVVKRATGTVHTPDLQRFITEAAYSPEQITDETWRAGFHNQCLKRAFEQPKTSIETHDYELAKDFWLGEFPKMADKTRSSILAGVMGILHTSNVGIVREMVSGRTTINPDEVLQGRWWLLDMPISEWGDSGAFVAASLKYTIQRAVLRRHAQPDDPVVVIWGDESPTIVNGFDPTYLAQCRSHKGCMVYLAQSLASYYVALKGQTGKHQVDALLTNFGVKIAHALGDPQSADYFANLIGRAKQVNFSGSSGQQQDVWGELFGPSGMTGSFSEHMENIVQAREFMSGLRTGGAASGYVCDAIIVKSGEPFSNGSNWLRTSFKQRQS
jgi:TraM recognition site of TraD and TraG